MNKHCVTGRITKEPELRQTQSGKSVCSFTLAVARPRVKDITDFLNFVVWQQGAEFLCKYGHRGDMVEVTGALTTRSYEDSNGNKRTVYETLVDEVKLLSGGSSSSSKQTPSENASNQNAPYSDGVAFEEMTSDEDFPF